MGYRNLAALVAAALMIAAAPAVAATSTDFEGFTTGVSVNGQGSQGGGWSVAGGGQDASGANAAFDEEVVDDGTGNTVWRVSNAVTSGAFGNQPFAPRPGGLPTDTVNDPVNSTPSAFAGESSTGAAFNRFYAEFDFKSATGAAQTGLSITVSGDNGQGGRHGFFDLEDNGSGLDIVTYDLDTVGNFVGPITIASGLSYTAWNTIGIEVLFNDGVNNDVVNYFVNGSLVHTGQSWEEYYRNVQAAQHPNGVPIQTLIYRISGGALASVAGQGFYVDNVTTDVSNVTVVPLPAGAWMGISLLGGLGVVRRIRARRLGAC